MGKIIKEEAMMDLAEQLMSVFSTEIKVNHLQELGEEICLVYLIDYHTRKHYVGFDDMAGFLFVKSNNRFNVFWAFQTHCGGDRGDYDGLIIDRAKLQNLKESLDIIEDENRYDWIKGTDNHNDRIKVAKLIEDIKLCEGL